MSAKPDDKRRIDLLRAELLDIGLDWNNHYQLVDEGTKWVLDLSRSIKSKERRRARELLELIMNR
jgi:hypothetical protein